MTRFNSHHNWKILAGMISPLVLIVTGLPQGLPAHANTDWLISLEFPPTNANNPSSTAGGGVRGNSAGLCIAENDALTALGPKDQKLTTVAATPTLFFYIPEIINTVPRVPLEAELVITDKMGKDLAGTPLKLELPNQSGIIKLSLPEDIKLESGQEYIWQFSILCDPSDRGSDAWIQGTLQRTELTSSVLSELAGATPLKQAELYAQARIWNETLEIAAQLREQDQTPWEQLLESVGLDQLAEIPFVEVMTEEQ